MIEPYQALGLVPTMRGIRRRDEIQVNLEHLSHLIKAASWLSSLDLPVRLIAVPEGALQGFNDEVLDLDHEEFARECAIDVPGPETDYLGALARQWNVFLMAQAKARHPEFPGRFFNCSFLIGPDAHVVERFTRTGKAEIRYAFTVEDPANYREPWTGEMVFQPLADPIYEYACHEGNNSLPGMLQGARYVEAHPEPAGR